MTRFDPHNKSLLNLRDSVCVLTGGSTGIGHATVYILAGQGAKVVFGDDAACPEDLSRLENVTHVRCDVHNYADIVTLFDTALRQHGRVDHAVANAGAIERGGWFDASLGIDGVRSGPPEATGLDTTDTRGQMWFAHVAVQYLSHGAPWAEGYENKSLTLVVGIASWLEAPGLFAWQSSTHAVLGLMRSLRLYLPGAFGDGRGGGGGGGGIRINCVSPRVTDDMRMTAVGIKAARAEQGAPPNRLADVARVIVGVARAGRGCQAVWYDGKEAAGVRRRRNWGGMDWDDDEKEARGMTGRNWVVLGGEAWDVEEGLDRTMDLWLGAKAAEEVQGGQRVLGVGKDWIKG